MTTPAEEEYWHCLVNLQLLSNPSCKRESFCKTQVTWE